VQPDARVVYVDFDPVVVAHSNALRSVQPGLTTILADRAGVAPVGSVEHDGRMGRWILIIVGALLVLTGVTWTLQGLGYVGGSVMSGVTFWAVVGPLVALAGLGLVVMAVRRRRA
jgi:S-adenosyl methyltransferase